MSTQLTVGSDTFLYPDNNENPGWGEEASSWAAAISEIVNNFQGPNDINPTITAIIANTSNTPVTGLFFNATSGVVAFIATYVIQLSGAVETGTLRGFVDGSGNWHFDRNFVGDASIEFDMMPTGQFIYTSGNLGNGTMKFYAKTIDL